jgi:hypothetical protein
VPYSPDIISEGSITERELGNLAFALGMPVSLLMVVGEYNEEPPIPTLQEIILDRIRLNHFGKTVS